MSADLAIHDCWNRIGVAGDQSCPKLAVHIHCRNCEMYAGAAQRNLQRQVDREYKLHWASHFRQGGPDATAAAGTAPDSAGLVFRIGREWLALPAQLFVSVTPPARPHTLPHRAGLGLRGIVNIAGKLYPCVGLAELLDIDEQYQPPAKGRHTFARQLLLEWEAQAFALPVAELHGIVRYAGAAARTPATTLNKGLARFLTGVLEFEDMQIGCLDAALIGQQLAKALR
jgi:chemotaxis-related protein WspD